MRRLRVICVFSFHLKQWAIILASQFYDEFYFVDAVLSRLSNQQFILSILDGGCHWDLQYWRAWLLLVLRFHIQSMQPVKGNVKWTLSFRTIIFLPIISLGVQVRSQLSIWILKWFIRNTVKVLSSSADMSERPISFNNLEPNHAIDNDVCFSFCWSCRVKHVMVTTLLLVCGAMTITWICDTISESGFGTGLDMLDIFICTLILVLCIYDKTYTYPISCLFWFIFISGQGSNLIICVGILTGYTEMLYNMLSRLSGAWLDKLDAAKVMVLYFVLYDACMMEINVKNS